MKEHKTVFNEKTQNSHNFDPPPAPPPPPKKKKKQQQQQRRRSPQRQSIRNGTYCTRSFFITIIFSSATVCERKKKQFIEK